MGFQQFPTPAASGGGSFPVTTSIKNAHAGLTTVVPVNISMVDKNTHLITLSGALTASTLKTMLSISGAGMLRALGICAVDSTARALRLKVTMDGIVVYDAATTSVARSAGTGLVAVGTLITNNVDAGTFTGALHEGMHRFATSLLVEISSSLTETDKLQMVTTYDLQ